MNKKAKLKFRFKNKGAAVISVSAVIVLLLVICLVIWGVSKPSVDEGSVETVTYELNNDFSFTALTGCMDSVPNTMSAIKNAASSNCANIEVDLMFNSKDEPVLTDNADSVDKKTTIPLTVLFKTLRVYYPDVNVVLHLHELTNLERVEEIAEEYGMLEKIYFSGVNVDNVEYIKFKTPNIRYIMDMDLDNDLIEDQQYRQYLFGKIDGAFSVNVDFKETSLKWIEFLANNSRNVSVYNVSGKSNAFKLWDLNVQNIFTDEPEEMQDFLREWLENK